MKLTQDKIFDYLYQLSNKFPRYSPVAILVIMFGMSMKGRHIPNRLCKYRKAAGYTQIQVARHLGFRSTDRISRWEKGLSMPSSDNLMKLIILYECQPIDLYPERMEEFRQQLKHKLQA